MDFERRSLLDVSDLSKEEILFFISETARVKKTPSQKFLPPSDKTVALLFFEPSTRTQKSFEMAAIKLGLRSLSFTTEGSSMKKGESVFDTARNISAMHPDVLVIRHGGSGIPWQISKMLDVPVINAGDGFHAHPTQALLDAFTIWETFQEFKGLNVLIVGDIAHSRVARSNIQALKKLGARVSVCGPPTLIPPMAEELGVKVYDNFDKCLPEMDVVMMLRIQVERQNSFQVPSMKEYTTRYGMTPDRLAKVKSTGIIMHPGPINRGVEIMSSVLRDGRCRVDQQVQNGVELRSVLLSKTLGIKL